MKLLKIGIYNEELYADFVDYIEALPKSVKTGTVMARLIAWYMQQPGDSRTTTDGTACSAWSLRQDC